MNKKGWILVSSIVGGLVIIMTMAIIGGKDYMDHHNEEQHAEMIKIVESTEAKKIFEEDLKSLDSKALTKDGIIKSFKIDYDSIKRNPMGGIDLTLLVNNDKSLYVRITLDKDNNGTLEEGSGGYSSKLESMLKEK